MPKYLLKNALIIRSDHMSEGELSIVGNKIERIVFYDKTDERLDSILDNSYQRIDLSGKYLFAGAIDAHVHFREPGLTHKANIETESRAAVLGGVTSFIDMPNTNPATISIERIREKKSLAEKSSYINYAFNIGASNENISEIEALVEADTKKEFGAVKVFMGSSTGNMLVDDNSTLDRLFRIKDKAIFIHSEDENIIKENTKKAISLYGDDIPFEQHSKIRSSLACIKATAKALEAAMKYNTRLHVLHISTAEEIAMVKAAKMYNPNISIETSVNYLSFSDEDYADKKGFIKCNPAIKSQRDRQALIRALEEGIIDCIGSDHAPHLKSEKEKKYIQCPSGLPSIGQSFPAMLKLFKENDLKLTYLASIMSENISRILGIDKRGRLQEGSYADIVVFDPDKYKLVEEHAYFCGWSPYTGQEFNSIDYVFVNGHIVVKDNKLAQEERDTMPLVFFS